ncbi:hypothetical protein G6F22_015915 [Rhizopus arrhizus]|nr:hypothetical protein G6F22_015915 [Rhizopus arrhizus]
MLCRKPAFMPSPWRACPRPAGCGGSQRAAQRQHHVAGFAKEVAAADLADHRVIARVEQVGHVDAHAPARIDPVAGTQVPHRASRRAHPDRRIVVGRVGIAALRGHPAPDRDGVPFARQLVRGRQPQQMARRFGADGLAFVILAGQIRIAGHHLPARSQLTAGFQLEPLAAQVAAIAVAIARGERPRAAGRDVLVHDGEAGLADGKDRGGHVQPAVVQFTLHAGLVVGANGRIQRRSR